MSSFIGIFSYALGAILIPGILFIIAIVSAKKSSVAAWILFAIGAVLELLSRTGSAKTIEMASGRVPYETLTLMKTQNIVAWGVFIVFAVITIVQITKRADKKTQ